jgi:hypothetical protein
MRRKLLCELCGRRPASRTAAIRVTPEDGASLRYPARLCLPCFQSFLREKQCRRQARPLEVKR